MRVDSSGNVGIGTTSPLSRLDTHANSNTLIPLKAINTNNNVDTDPAVTQTVLRVQRVGKSASTFNSTVDFGISRYEVSGINGRTQMDVRLTHSGVSDPEVTVMSLRSNGNVGIGTTSPATKLDVNGDVTITDKIIHSGDTNTAIRFPANDTVAIETDGVERMRVDSSGNVGIGTTSPSAPLAVSNAGAEGVEMGWSAGASVGFFQAYNRSTSAFVDVAIFGNNIKLQSGSSGTEHMRIDSSGNVGIGTTSPAEKLHVSHNGPIIMKLERTGASAASITLSIFGVGVNNYLALGGERLTHTGTDNTTTASAANVFIGTDSSSVASVFQRSTSSRKYKTEIQDANFGLADVAKLRPVTYKGINDGDKIFGGLIAEEVHDAGLKMFVQYNEEGEPDSLAYTHMVALCVKAIQEQQTIINDLKARLDNANL
jgi:hypothetical protein